MVLSVPVSEARSRFAELIDKVRRDREPVMVTRNGRPAVVMVDAEDWERAAVALKALEDAEDAAAFAAAMAADDGTRIPLAAVLAELGESGSQQ
jgi:prevent-host-death family protein